MIADYDLRRRVCLYAEQLRKGWQGDRASPDIETFLADRLEIIVKAEQERLMAKLVQSHDA